MKICHMTSAHDSQDIRILKKECVSLAKVEGNDVYLVAKGDSYEYKGVHVEGIGNVEGNRIKRILSISKKIYKKAIEIDADIYHLHDPELLLYVKKLRKHGKKVIFDAHEYYYQQFNGKYYIPAHLRKFMANIYKQVEDSACKYLNGAIFPCPINGQHIYKDRVKNCEFIDNLPMLDEMSFEEKRDVSENMTVCCIGSLTEERGIGKLIEGCYLAKANLILGGNFSPAEYGEQLKKSEEFSVVDYRGYCSREEVKDIYSQSFIGASTILNRGQYYIIENLPTKVYEYMMMGMPFIISDTKQGKYVTEKYKCGIAVNPENAQEIADAITYLRENPKEAIAMGENGRKAAKEIFNWGIEEKKLYDFYDKVYKDN